jgi:thiamine pyrophosphokinase
MFFMPRVVIFANGQLPDLDAAHALLQNDDYIIAADGGANHLIKMSILPEALIGDLDSVDETTLSHLKSAGVRIKRFPTDKNETDIELALNAALKLEPSAILIVGALGGRLDQTLANLSLLTNPTLSGIDIRLDDGVEEAFFCRKQAEVYGRSGEIVSLIPWNGPVEGVTTEGLQWPLHSETLYPDKSRGVSNAMLKDEASIRIQSGLLLVVHRRSFENKE